MLWKRRPRCEHGLGRNKQGAKRKLRNQPHNASDSLQLRNQWKILQSCSLPAPCPAPLPPVLGPYGHLPPCAARVCICFTICSCGFSSHPTFSLWMFASGSFGLSLCRYLPVFHWEPELSPELHTIKPDCLRDSSPRVFRKHLQLSASKNHIQRLHHQMHFSVSIHYVIYI